VRARTWAPVAAALAVVCSAVLIVFSKFVIFGLVLGLAVIACVSFLYVKLLALLPREEPPAGAAPGEAARLAETLDALAAGRTAQLPALSEDIAGPLRRLADRMEGLEAEVADLTPRDDLTSLAKEDVFNNVLWREFSRAGRYDAPLSVALIDVRGLDELRSGEGQARADQVLKDVSSLVLQMIRETDLAARYGRAQIAVAMPGTGAEGAREFANRVARAVDSDEGGLELPEAVTLAVGTASVPDEEIKTVPGLVERASAALGAREGS